MKTNPVPGLLALILLLPVLALAQDSEALDEPAETPDEPVITSDYQRNPDEPQVIITSGEDATFYEYRVNGQLQEIKVVPKVGPAYYLVPDESGDLMREDRPRTMVPNWIIFRW